MARRFGSSEDRFGFKAKGTFRCAYKRELSLCVIALVITALLIALSSVVSRHIQENNWFPFAEIFMFALLGAASVMIGIGLLRMVLIGRLLSYEADEKEFAITEKNGSKTVIYFCDVTGVDYKPVKLLWRVRGYKAQIHTKYRTIEYKYVFSRNKVVRSPEGSPFIIIEERAGLRKDERDFI